MWVLGGLVLIGYVTAFFWFGARQYWKDVRDVAEGGDGNLDHYPEDTRQRIVEDAQRLREERKKG